MLIYTEHHSSRLSYASEVLFGPFGIDVRFTSDKNEFATSPLIRINYSADDPGDSIHIVPHTWLRDGEQSMPVPEIGEWRGVPTLFHREKGTVPFDIFAAVFFLASRFEEYHPFEGDEMGRFEVADSFAGKHQLHQRPLIDEWREQMVQLFLPFSSHEEVTRPQPAHLLTLDIDSAFAYRHKGWYRTLGGFAKDLVRADFRNLKKRWSVVNKSSDDPYDTYEYILRTCGQLGISPRWFFLLANFGTYDKNVPHTSEELRKLIRRLDAHAGVGIHPGVASHKSEALLSEEINRLVEITRRPVIASRQHYLKLTFPETYRSLLRCGIRRDYSMGYSSDTGFRLGTSHEIKWYDVERDEKTELSLIPFCAMDTTLRKYLKLDPEQAISHLRSLHAHLALCNGKFVVLWHNESLCEEGAWTNWRLVFEEAAHLVAQSQKATK